MAEFMHLAADSRQIEFLEPIQTSGLTGARAIVKEHADKVVGDGTMQAPYHGPQGTGAEHHSRRLSESYTTHIHMAQLLSVSGKSLALYLSIELVCSCKPSKR